MKGNLCKAASFWILLGIALVPSACLRHLEVPVGPKVVNVTDSSRIIRTEGPVALKPNVYVLDTASIDNVVSVEPDKVILKPNTRLRGGRQAANFVANEIGIGSVIVADRTSKTPSGLLARVTGRRETTDGVELTTEQGFFTDLFNDVNFTKTESFGVNLNETAKVDAPNGTDGPVKFEMKVGGKMDFKLTLGLHIEKGSLTEATAKYELIRNLAYSVKLEAGRSVIEEVTVLRRPIYVTLYVPVGWLLVPVVINPELTVALRAEATATGAFTVTPLNFTQTSEYGAHFTPQKGIEKIEKTQPFENRPSFNITGKLEVKGGVIGRLDLKFYGGIVTLRGTLYAYGALTGDCSERDGLVINPSAGIADSASAKLDIFGAIKVGVGLAGDLNVRLTPFVYSTSICKKDTSTEKPIVNEVEEASTSVSTADPHMTTFDRGRYDFMAVGEFVAAKSTTDNFQVQVRQAPYPGSTQVSVNTGVAMQMGNDRICVYPEPSRLYVNSQPVALSFTDYALNSGGSIRNNNGRLLITNGNGDRVEVKLLTNDLDYFITPAKNRKGKLTGLFGNYDGNSLNDLILTDGKTIANKYSDLYPAFANSWRIAQDQSLFMYDAGKNTDSYTDKNFPRSEVQLTASQSAVAEQICRQAGITDPNALQGCIVDVALTGNQSFAERAKQNEIISNAKNTLSVSNFSQYRNEFTLSSGATANGSNVVLGSKGIISWNDAYINREGYETEIVLAVNAPSPCFPLFDIDVLDTQTAGNQSFLRLSTNSGRTQIELVNSSVQPQIHPVNFFDGNRHRVRIVAAKSISGSQTRIRLVVYIDNYEGLIIDSAYLTSSLAGYLYPSLKNETLNCANGQITIYGWSFRAAQ